LGLFDYGVNGGGEAGGKFRRMIVAAMDFLREGEAADSGDGLFTGGVDIKDEQTISIWKGRDELIHQKIGAGVAMGLEDDMDASLGAEPLTGGRERGENFRWVMTVIVNDTNSGGATS
jgi:hypothetical protein